VNERQNGGQSPCCEGSDCCQPSGSGEGRRNKRWKTLVFTAVILLAGAVTAYSLFWRDRGAVNSSCCPPGSAECATPCVVVAPMPGFDDRLAGADFSLTVLLPAGCEFPQQAGDAIHAVITDLEAKGTQVRMLYLTPADSAFAAAADRCKITSCPTVLVQTKSGSTVLAQAGISKDSILSIYTLSRNAIRTKVTSDAGRPR
jgi:hypothetical protein